MRAALALIILLFSFPVFPEQVNSKYFVFIGKKISLEPVPPKAGEILLDSQFLATYEILEPYWGTHKGKSIEFTVYDHHGTPQFSLYEHVLLYVEMHDGQYFHSKYQFSPLYKDRSGKWAGTYASYDYEHSYNKNTPIKPIRIEFNEPVFYDISDVTKDRIAKIFPEPYYRIEGKKAIAVYGNYVDELFRLKQSGVLKARGDFQ
ncbi:hypothetical protein HNE05_08070 [Aquipseudomonas campi]|uniref:Uncharacterized protein n=1 Tax=Aquipseudomonas campi TaxID=2731681 RepID=A0A6M8FGP7_9GAMM|nr:hypothetical protein [Pseudomonas campi]QKE63320.1 hypothetical protein HNE05_08070 [Pseudomonas campi]